MTLQHASLETRPADVEAEVAFWALLGFARVEPRGFGPLSIETPVWSSADLTALALGAAALVAALRFKAGVLPLLGGCALAGLILRGGLGL